MKDHLLHLRSLARKKEAQSLLGIFGFLRKHILHPRIQLLPTYWVIRKAASFGWGSEKERALQQVQAAIPAALLLGLSNQAEPRVLEVSDGK